MKNILLIICTLFLFTNISGQKLSFKFSEILDVDNFEVHKHIHSDANRHVYCFIKKSGWKRKDPKYMFKIYDANLKEISSLLYKPKGLKNAPHSMYWFNNQIVCLHESNKDGKHLVVSRIDQNLKVKAPIRIKTKSDDIVSTDISVDRKHLIVNLNNMTLFNSGKASELTTLVLNQDFDVIQKNNYDRKDLLNKKEYRRLFIRSSFLSGSDVYLLISYLPKLSILEKLNEVAIYSPQKYFILKLQSDGTLQKIPIETGDEKLRYLKVIKEDNRVFLLGTLARKIQGYPHGITWGIFKGEGDQVSLKTHVFTEEEYKRIGKKAIRNKGDLKKRSLKEHISFDHIIMRSDSSISMVARMYDVNISTTTMGGSTSTSKTYLDHHNFEFDFTPDATYLGLKVVPNALKTSDVTYTSVNPLVFKDKLYYINNVTKKALDKDYSTPDEYMKLFQLKFVLSFVSPTDTGFKRKKLLSEDYGKFILMPRVTEQIADNKYLFYIQKGYNRNKSHLVIMTIEDE